MRSACCDHTKGHHQHGNKEEEEPLPYFHAKRRQSPRVDPPHPSHPGCLQLSAASRVSTSQWRLVRHWCGLDCPCNLSLRLLVAISQDPDDWSRGESN